MNDIISEAAGQHEGIGEAVGRTIEEQAFPHRELSLAAAGWRSGVPVTCHVGIGNDIRTVADGGQSFHFRADHRQTIPSLWHGLTVPTPSGRGLG